LIDNILSYPIIFKDNATPMALPPPYARRQGRRTLFANPAL